MFKNANEFSIHIERYARSKRMTYMDAVLEYCKDNFLEPDEISKLINKSLKAKIETNFIELNYLPKVSQLDV